MPFLLHLRITVSILWRFAINRYTKPDLVLVGAMTSIEWSQSGTALTGYISFAEEPEGDDDLDVFGISKKETFHWLGGIRDLIFLVWNRHPNGWTVRDATLIYAAVIE